MTIISILMSMCSQELGLPWFFFRLDHKDFHFNFWFLLFKRCWFYHWGNQSTNIRLESDVSEILDAQRPHPPLFMNKPGSLFKEAFFFLLNSVLSFFFIAKSELILDCSRHFIGKVGIPFLCNIKQNAVISWHFWTRYVCYFLKFINFEKTSL